MGYFGSAPSLQKSNMLSPPYTPYDQSPPQIQQYVDPLMINNYQGFTSNPIAPVSTGYATQYSPPERVSYGNEQYMQQCPLPPVQGMSIQNPLQMCSMNPTIAMQATVFTTSPSSSTVCYQPAPNLTDLQFPAEPQAFSGFNEMPTTNAGATHRGYVSSARERYNSAVPGVNIGSKRPRENPAPQSRGISDWSPQWLQGAAPPAHVY